MCVFWWGGGSQACVRIILVLSRKEEKLMGGGRRESVSAWEMATVATQCELVLTVVVSTKAGR